MGCRRCPHHVRHGQMAKDTNALEFSNLCGLKLKRLQDQDFVQKKGRTKGKQSSDTKLQKNIADGEAECMHYPFPEDFDYFSCPVYQQTFSSQGLKNGVVPTKDLEFTESISNVSVTDLEFL